MTFADEMRAIPFFLVTAATLVSLEVLGRADEEQFEIEVQETRFDFSRHIGKTSSWDLAHGNAVRISMDGKETVFSNGGGTEIYRIKPPQYVAGVSRAPKGGSIAFRLMQRREDGYGSDYSSLLTLRSTRAKVEVSEVWKEGDKAVLKSRWWVSELGAISEDGSRILVKLGIHRPAGRMSIVDYSWQTWDVSPPRKLGTGLRVENGHVDED